MTEDKQAAYDTLFEVLLGTAKLMAPLAPFYAEWMYDHLSAYARKDGRLSSSRVLAKHESYSNQS